MGEEIVHESFEIETVPGHHIGVEIYEWENAVTKALDECAEEHGLSRQNREKVRITEGDVVWDDTTTLSIPVEQFETLIDEYRAVQAERKNGCEKNACGHYHPLPCGLDRDCPVPREYFDATENSEQIYERYEADQ